MSHLAEQKVLFYEGTNTSLQVQITEALLSHAGLYELKSIALAPLGGGHAVCACLWEKEELNR
jgi:hypothetical protein